MWVCTTTALGWIFKKGVGELRSHIGRLLQGSVCFDLKKGREREREKYLKAGKKLSSDSLQVCLFVSLALLHTLTLLIILFLCSQCTCRSFFLSFSPLSCLSPVTENDAHVLKLSGREMAVERGLSAAAAGVGAGAGWRVIVWMKWGLKVYELERKWSRLKNDDTGRWFQPKNVSAQESPHPMFKLCESCSSVSIHAMCEAFFSL